MSDIPEVTGEVTLSNSFLGDTVQVCVVTRDYRRTMEGMVRLGIGPWRVYTFGKPHVTDMTYRGRPAEFSMKLCLAFSGTMLWEIIEPREGRTIYHDFLDAHGEGVHHVAFGCNGMPWRARIEEFERRGFEKIQSGIWAGRVPWAYFATEDATSTTFEIYDIPADMTFPEPEQWYPARPPGA